MTLNELKEVVENDNHGELVFIRKEHIRAIISLLERCEPFVRIHSESARRQGKTTAQELLAILRSEKPIGE